MGKTEVYSLLSMKFADFSHQNRISQVLQNLNFSMNDYSIFSQNFNGNV